ncbi:SusC/RagA family TonB-linked outer membrane protein [Chitinophaga sp. XS-30]|uniref:SusC/RagA family TonB-linked outer membrane protein n=1 Tax=Chitinophaga sp. XS-30 TaxID=2604421 RepID=UPI0011DCFE3E|nr:SusC/RagA family TonB-linked outer membrane protein [Chitinophaga sp. XS-30]QEH42299.1 SusC/RagA family TonB-linked outer membrane protein [Chitinophaga sp. XS-30]
MKLTDYLKSPPGVTWHRYAIKMRLFALFTVLFFLQAFSYAQAQEVTMNVKNAPLSTVFREIRQQTGYAFLYNNASLNGTKNVTINVTKAPLAEVLQMALADQPITFTISNKTIILKPAATYPKDPEPAPGELLEVHSRVIDARTKEPIPGASVAVLGTKSGVISGPDGRYVIRVPKGTKLQISFMGYETLVVTIQQSGEHVHSLSVSQQSIKDVVVTGVFSRPKQNFTGAATSFTQEDLSRVTNNNVLSALKALDPSFQMPENINLGSNPNALPEVVLRGGNSLVDISQTNNDAIFNYNNSPNVPLFILDGFETSLQRINDLDMNRIAKVDILKDAAATAIYGSRAANGVIVIETIRPQSGKLRVTYNASMFVEAPDLTGYDLLDAKEKLDLEYKAGVYNNSWNSTNEQLQYFYNHRLSEIQRGVNTDWMAQPLRTGIGQKHNIYVEGGADDALYGVSLTYDNQQGVMKGSDRRNMMGNTYLSYRIKNFQFRNDLTISANRGNESPYGSFREYTRLNPYWTPYDEDGNMKVYLEEVRTIDGTYLRNFDNYDNLDSRGPGRAVNPLYNATLNTVHRSTYLNLTNNFSAQWQATPWLRLSSRLAITQQKDELDVFRPAQHTSFVATPTFEKGTYQKGYGRRNTSEGMLMADANKRFGDHMFFGTIGWNFQDIAHSGEHFTVQGFPNPSMDQLTLGNQFPVGSKPFGSEYRSRLLGYLSNLSYAYDNRYLLDLSYRLDGSSQFGSEKRFAPFWSVGAGWNLHNEKMLRDLSFINRFKLRYSLGYTGSQNFPSYLGLNTSNYYTGMEYRGIIGTQLIGFGNPALAWQQTLKSNFGADITLFNRLDVVANYFVETTQGSIANISLPPSSGFGTYAENMGDVLSKGWEVNARVNLINNPGSRNNLSVFVNAFHVKSTIEKVSNTLKQMNKRADTTYSSTPLIRYAEGQSTTAIWAVESLGIDPSTGNEIFRTRDGKLTNTYSPLDQIIVGDSRPKVEGTFGTNLEINGIGMNLFFRFRYGGQAYNQTLIDRVENVAYAYYNVDRRVAEDRWMKPGDQTFFKALVPADGVTGSITRASSRFVQDNNELICESLSAYYRFSDELNKQLRLQNTRITFFTGDLFRFTSIKRERGLAYPFSRTFTLQLQTSF